VTPADALPAEPLALEGEPFARGLAQARACPELVGAVRRAVEARLGEAAPALARPEVRAFVAAQRALTGRLYPEILAEIAGLARGFGLGEAALLDYLHAATALDLVARDGPPAEACTAFALTAGRGALLAKNRDYRAEHVPIQKVMRHRDPAWGGREILVLGSLGSPGCFSSGLNSDGLALADTASRTSDLGVGLHRYFLMTLLLVRCADVAEALSLIRTTPHTGSGLLILADAQGAVAAVELGHRAIGFEHLSSGRVGRTNHFLTPRMAPANLATAATAASRLNSEGRWPALRQGLSALPEPPDVLAVGRLLARHADAEGPAFCRHGGRDAAATIAGAIWLTAERRLLACHGPPCSTPWWRYGLAAEAAGPDAPRPAPDPDPGARP
jgi:hypothetical protein